MLDLLVIFAVITAMVAANALYVAAEFATVGARRSRVQERAEAGDRSAGRLLGILHDPKKVDTYVAGCQIGITLSSLVAGAYGQARLTPIIDPLLGSAGGTAASVIIVLLIITVLQVVLGELLPKTIALRYPERLSIATLPPMRLSLLLFRPLITIFNGTAFALMRLFRLHGDHSHTHVHSPEELEGLFKDSAAGGLIDADERDMLFGALAVHDRTLREIMTPRTRTVTVSARETVSQALARVAGAPFSRFPVSAEDADELIGIVHIRSLFAASERDPTASVESVMLEPLIFAETLTVPLFWQRLREQGRRSALVLNEYGSISGMVTLEDALEEVFGEVQDEFDDEEDVFIQREDGAASVRGDVNLATLADRYDIVLPSDRADTIGGLAWHEFGRLPNAGEEVAVRDTDYRLQVEAVNGYLIQRVLLTRVVDEQPEPEA
ncbi:hemolysin family protein [Croceibacterium ferulae]|uniref:hemolysin family protein n=1 Tax=Croceibacterium ferulae TaxID=1854641 RepID=UPI00138FE0CD|nr:hemolysin family protein [Croceibacterium ferulae]